MYPLFLSSCCLFAASILCGAETSPTEATPAQPVQSDEQEVSALPAAPSATRQGSKKEAKAKDEHVISQSRVFSVSGGDAMRMGAIASRADDIRHQLCRLLKLPETRGLNISLRLTGSFTDPRVYPSMRRSLDIIGDKPSLSLTIASGGGIDLIDLNKNIVAMCLYEYVLRSLDANAFEKKISIPEWLIVGIQQAVLWRNGKIDREVYQQLFARAEMLSPEQIINCKDPWSLDAVSRQVYEASCAVVILGLLNQEQGDENIRQMLRDSLLSEGSAKDLIAQYFHELGVSSASLVKWWALELANLAVNKATESMTPMETERLLREALTITYFDPVTRVPERVSFEDVYRIVQLKDWERRLRPIPTALSLMSVRCFPSYRSFILEYVRAIDVLMKTKDPDAVQEIIGPLRQLRESYITTMTRVRDYLDWYEITHTGQKSGGNFDAYLDAMKMLRYNLKEKSTPISDYLRDIELLYQLPKDAPLPKSLQAKKAD